MQTLLYADAVNRAGSFNPCAVVEALEGFEFDGMGNGPTLYRAEDHQCFKDVVVVRGQGETPKASSTSWKSSRSRRSSRSPMPPTTRSSAAPRRRSAPAIPERDLTVGRVDVRPRSGADVDPAGLTDRAPRGAADRNPEGRDMDAIILQILNGLDKGSAYALIALGLTLIFGHPRRRELRSRGRCS